MEHYNYGFNLHESLYNQLRIKSDPEIGFLKINLY